jgi:rubrerythrin
MSDPRKEMLDAVLRAMEMEKETFDFYTKAEQKTFDPGGKRIFHWLARTEEQHYLKLSELYASLHAGGRWVFYGGTTIALEPGGEEAQKIGFETTDLEALEIAGEIERKGHAYYEELLATTTDPDGRTMLATLRDEEVEHLRVITEKYHELKSRG